MTLNNKNLKGLDVASLVGIVFGGAIDFEEENAEELEDIENNYIETAVPGEVQVNEEDIGRRVMLNATDLEGLGIAAITRIVFSPVVEFEGGAPLVPLIPFTEILVGSVPFSENLYFAS